MPGPGAERLAEWSIVEHPADACDMGEHAVEHASPVLIGIEARGDMVPQVTTSLGDAKSQGMLDRPPDQARAMVREND